MPRFSSVRGFSSAWLSSAGLPRFSAAGDLGAAGDLDLLLESLDPLDLELEPSDGFDLLLELFEPLGDEERLLDGELFAMLLRSTVKQAQHMKQ